ncbi:hypothetical protein C8R44DRAFT_744523 [Mycena epipterygia]|nr:hypothetical protein C8R44DRAFT_744523 [Mycena epipterygia]
MIGMRDHETHYGPHAEGDEFMIRTVRINSTERSDEGFFDILQQAQSTSEAEAGVYPHRVRRERNKMFDVLHEDAGKLDISQYPVAGWDISVRESHPWPYVQPNSRQVRVLVKIGNAVERKECPSDWVVEGNTTLEFPNGGYLSRIWISVENGEEISRLERRCRISRQGTLSGRPERVSACYPSKLWTSP